METFTCMILNTDYMIKLLFYTDNIENYKEEIEILENWEKYNSVKDIIKLNNRHINKAIKELLEKDETITQLEEISQININELKESLK